MEWQLKDRDLKNYPHFDSAISASDAVVYATNPDTVSSHAFFPFIRFKQRWTRFAEKGELGRPKERELRYAARRDAYIFAYYRFLLSEPYEKTLAAYGLSDRILAYRRIVDPATGSGKCNIHFAKEAFLKIKSLGDCCAIALDISSFFESIDHQLLKQLWCQLLGKNKLPSDHYAVFRAITEYAVVDKEKVYERLGHFGPKRKTAGGKIIPGYLTPYRKVPKQLCPGKEFREKIASKKGGKSIIEKHYKPYGIPQGAPISDLLANLYLLNFDIEINAKVSSLGGTYYRYSDDIMIVVPIPPAQAESLEADIRDRISAYGSKLEIRADKTSIVSYLGAAGGDQTCALIRGDNACKQGIEYLGFRYSGKNAYIRNRTIQNLYRKITYAARREAIGLARRYPGKKATEIIDRFNFEKFKERFGRVEDFHELRDNYRKWTFWTYANRAAKEFGSLGKPIRHQLRRMGTIMRHKVDSEIIAAVKGRDNPYRKKTTLIKKP